MDDTVFVSLPEAGPFYAVNQYVIATNPGPGYGNTVAQCFPIRCPGGTVISANQFATRLADALNMLSWQE